MSKSVDEAYRKVQKLFDDLAAPMPRDDYKEFIEKVEGHVSSCGDCVRDEEKEEQQNG